MPEFVAEAIQSGGDRVQAECPCPLNPRGYNEPVREWSAARRSEPDTLGTSRLLVSGGERRQVIDDLGKLMDGHRGHRALHAALEFVDGDPAVNRVTPELSDDVGPVAIRRADAAALKFA